MAGEVVWVRIDRDPSYFPKNLLKYGPKIDLATQEFLYKEGTELLARSLPLVPVQTGVLKSSGFVSMPEREPGSNFTVVVGYGGPAADYAIYVHEILDRKHPVGQAKFLEQPFLEHQIGIRERYALHIRRVIERGP